MNENNLKAARLAFREEGDRWSAYCARLDTMDDAAWLGSVHMTVAKNPERKQQFMDLMQEVVADLIEELTGERPTWDKEQFVPQKTN